MNPFVYPEFWLSLAFFVVVGMIILPPVRKSLKAFFSGQRQVVEDKIREANDVYQEARQTHSQTIKLIKEDSNNKNLSHEIKLIQKEFLEKTKEAIEAKEQDFQVRQNLVQMETKNHVRSKLLDEAEKKILSCPSKSMTEKEVMHFIQMLHENEDNLKRAIDL